VTGGVSFIWSPTKGEALEKVCYESYAHVVMTIQLPLTPETEARLRQQALAAGVDITSYILEALEEKLSEGSHATNGSSTSDPMSILQSLDPAIWKGIDPIEYQRREREGWD
jgi:hypothetical protein